MAKNSELYLLHLYGKEICILISFFLLPNTGITEEGFYLQSHFLDYVNFLQAGQTQKNLTGILVWEFLFRNLKSIHTPPTSLPCNSL